MKDQYDLVEKILTLDILHYFLVCIYMDFMLGYLHLKLKKTRSNVWDFYVCVWFGVCLFVLFISKENLDL